MRTLILVMLFLSSGTGFFPAAAALPDANPQRIEAVIEHAEVVSESPLVVRVEGYYPVNCAMPSNYEIKQWGNEVRVSIYQVALSDTACRPQRVTYHETLPGYLFADLKPDTYYLDLNGYALRVTVRDLPPAPPVPPLPPVRFVDRDLCVGETLTIDPRAPTELYHYIEVAFQDAARPRGEVAVQYAHGTIRRLRETSAILAYRPGNRFGLSFEALREGDVTGSMRALTESMSPYGYRLIPLIEYRIHVVDCYTPPPAWRRSYAVIEAVDVIVLESFPMRLHLHVRGYYSMGCMGETRIEQWRERNRVSVELYQLVDPRVMCPDVITFFEETIPLEGSFEPGWYVIRVNGFEMTVRL